MRVQLLVLFALTLLAATMAQQEGGKRRRIKKKIVKNRIVPERRVLVVEGDEREEEVKAEKDVEEQVEAVEEYVGEVARQLFTAIEQEDVRDIAAENRPKQGRGFLDDYYAQFEARTEKAKAAQEVQDMQAAESIVGTPRLSPQFFQADTGERRDSEDELDQLLAKEEQLQALLAREAELSPAQREELLRQLSQWPTQQQQQSQGIYTGGLSDLTGSMGNEVTAKRHADEKPFGPSLYSTFQGLPGALTSDSSLDRDLSTAYLPPSSSYPTSYAEPDDLYKTTDIITSSGASKYIGLTGTTSQDIQLGLTFTVPFLSIPLSGINSLLGGGGSGGIGDLLSSGLGLFNLENIDVGSIATMAVIAIAAIFVLPQAIYWITGINLSTFSFSRSDDPDASGLVGLANTVDSALMEFSIDGKGCIAKSMCTTLFDKNKKTESVLVKALAGSALKNPNMMTFLGEDRISRLTDFESLSEKYGAKAGGCDSVFRATCPWETAGMTNIAMKLMASQGTNLADLAMKAASAAATNHSA